MSSSSEIIDRKSDTDASVPTSVPTRWSRDLVVQTRSANIDPLFGGTNTHSDMDMLHNVHTLHTVNKGKINQK